MGVKLRVTVSVAAVAALATLWYGPAKWLQQSTCQSEALQGLDAVSSRVCETQYQKVSPAMAKQAVSNYLGRSAGAKKRNGYQMLAESARATTDLSQFETDWRGMIFANGLPRRNP